MPLKDGNWCYGCGAYEYEPSGEKCKNPTWHVPDPKVYPPKVEERKEDAA